MDLPNKPVKLIFQLGRLQVFHYPDTMDEIQGLAPKEVYYQDVVSRHVFGPFNDTYMAMHHYSQLVQDQRRDAGKVDAPVLYIDFNRRKRIVFEEP